MRCKRKGKYTEGKEEVNKYRKSGSEGDEEIRDGVMNW